MAFSAFKTPKLQTSVVEIAAIVVVIILVAVFFIRPKMAELSQIRTQAKLQQEIYNRVERDSAELTRLISVMEESKNEVALLDEALPLESRVTRLNVLLDGLVSASGMTLSSMNVVVGDQISAGSKTAVDNKFDTKRSLQTFNADLRVTGKIDQFRSLLQLIETNGRIIDIENLDMTNEGGDPAFRLKLKSYSYAE